VGAGRVARDLHARFYGATRDDSAAATTDQAAQTADSNQTSSADSRQAAGGSKLWNRAECREWACRKRTMASRMLFAATQVRSGLRRTEMKVNVVNTMLDAPDHMVHGVVTRRSKPSWDIGIWHWGTWIVNHFNSTPALNLRST